MDPQHRSQVRLLLEHHSDLVREEFKRRLKGLQQSNASKGLLGTGATIKASIRIMEELASLLIKEATDQVLAITRDQDAFTLTHEALQVLSHGHLLRSARGPAQESQIDYLRVAVRALRQKLERNPAEPQLIINEPAVGYRLNSAAS